MVVRELKIWLVISILLLLASPAFAAPYAQSSWITGITWDNTSHVEEAEGSDNWPVTWSDDDDQYVVWGDGAGFSAATYPDCRVSLGVATISGPLATYTTEDLYGCTSADPSGMCEGDWSAGCGSTYPAERKGKSYGIISISGDLYMWWGPLSCTSSFANTQMLKSTDYGQTWSKSAWDLEDADDTIIMPTILNYGKDNASARDTYVYHYFVRCGGEDVGSTTCDDDGSPCGLVTQGGVTGAGFIDLARVPISDMQNNFATLNTKFEWFTGLDGNNDPTWGTAGDESVRKPVFTDPNGVGWNLSVSYNIGLDRYILITEHTASQVGNMGMFDAPEPWGPWTTIVYYTEPNDFQSKIGVGGDVGSEAFFWNFSQKWTSGADFVLFFTGGSAGAAM
jgi:hypothetical protein